MSTQASGRSGKRWGTVTSGFPDLADGVDVVSDNAVWTYGSWALLYDSSANLNKRYRGLYLVITGFDFDADHQIEIAKEIETGGTKESIASWKFDTGELFSPMPLNSKIVEEDFDLFARIATSAVGIHTVEANVMISDHSEEAFE